MKPQKQPSKEAVRAYMQGRFKVKSPPPSREEIRRQLGWFNKSAECAR